MLSILAAQGGVGARSGSQFLPRDTGKRRADNESDMECGDLSPLSFWRPGHSGDKSPHSKRAVIVRLLLTKAAPEATPTSYNCTQAAQAASETW